MFGDLLFWISWRAQKSIDSNLDAPFETNELQSTSFNISIKAFCFGQRYGLFGADSRKIKLGQPLQRVLVAAKIQLVSD